MARTNIDESAWKRIYKLATLMNCSEREAAGTVACLWHESQDELKLQGTPEEIIDWAHLFSLPSGDRHRWLEALERCRFISRESDGAYKVHGNEHHIEALVSKMSAAARGGAANKARWEKLKAERLDRENKNRGALEPDGYPEDSQIRASTEPDQSLIKAQYNTMQSKAEREEAIASSSTVLIKTRPAVHGRRESRAAEFKPETHEQLVDGIPSDTRQRWDRLYPDAEFLSRTTIRAFDWYQNNPRKKPQTVRGWVAALGYWYERGWRDHVRSMPGQAPNSTDWAKVFGEDRRDAR